MGRQISTCSVIEVIENEEGQPQHRELLPCADPYIARLLAKHRLESALHDSLAFLRSSGTVDERPPGPCRPPQG